MIQFDKVSKRYPGGFEALSEVDLTLERGEMAFLCGHSGAGKTTLLKLIACLESPSSGNLIVNGTYINAIKKHQIPSFRSSLGIIFQTSHLLQSSVFENVAIPLHMLGLSTTVIAKRVYAALDMVGLLNKEKMPALSLSCGEQQRVGIARAVVHKPALLIADEPTGNLDPVLSTDIMKIFEQFNQVGVSILIATHDLALIASMKRRIIVLKGGRLLC